MRRIRIMSQNQWSWSENTPYWEERGLDCSSEARMKGHARVFQELMPDIIGGLRELKAEKAPEQIESQEDLDREKIMAELEALKQKLRQQDEGEGTEHEENS